MTAALHKYAANVFLRCWGEKHAKGGGIGTISPLWTEDKKKDKFKKIRDMVRS